MKRRGSCVVACALVGLLASLSGAQTASQPSVDIQNLPVNRWVRLPEAPPALDYKFNNAVYDSVRKRLALYTPRGVVSFDSAAGNWALEYDAFPGKAPPGPRTLSGGGQGVSWGGSGALTASGHPAPSYTTYGACWDSKRSRMVLVMRGLMASYDPEVKKWTDLKAKTVLNGKEYPGGPPVYNTGVCYDPVNDEILMQPHFGTYSDWVYPGGDFPPILNMDRLNVDGRISSHLGTFRYTFADNTWRRVSDTFGNDEMKAARKAVLELTAAVSLATDQAWALRRRPDAFDRAKAKEALAGALRSAETLAGKLPAEAREPFGKAVPLLKAAAEAAAAGKWEEAMTAGGKAWWELDALLDDALRVEPEPRCNAPLVYDSKNQVIVVTGGSNGLVRTDVTPSERPKAGNPSLRTWIYDCKTRQWRRSKSVLPGDHAFFDPAGGLVCAITQKEANYGKEIPPTAALWALDAATGDCSKRHEQTWPAGPDFPGLSDRDANVAYDPERRLLLFTHLNDKRYETLAMRLDLSALPAGEKPSWGAIPIRPHTIPEDDPKWVEQLKALPANQWSIPWKEGPAMRDWGSAACDPVRGHIYYFGGGHATYQVNDVAIYAVGANQWVSGVGEHNDFFVPGVRWNGITKSFRGGHEAAHMAFYDALDGRMYVRSGTVKPMFADEAKSPEWRYSYFYDVDRGGVWRYRMISDMHMGEGVAAGIGFANLSDPTGRMLGFVGGFVWPGNQGVFSTLDVYTNRLTLQKMPAGGPGYPGEGIYHCYVAPMKKLFILTNKGTFLYDPEANAYTDLKPRVQPDSGKGRVNMVLSLDGHDAVYAIVNGGEEWVYSFKHNTWARFKTNKPGVVIPGPYGQMGYAAKYGVLVSTRDGVLRPDLGQVNWDEASGASKTEERKP